MKKRPVTGLSNIELRLRAEEKLGQGKKRASLLTQTPVDVDSLRLIQELEVHQLELELQNEELLQVRAELESSLARYSDLYDFAPVGYFTLTSDGTLTRANLTGARQLGVARGKLIGQRFGLYVAPEYLQAFDRFLQNVYLATEAQSACDLLINTAEAVSFWAHLEVTLAETGNECNLVMTNVTEIKRAFEQLQESEANYRLLAENISDVIWVLDLENVRYRYVSPSVLALRGYSAEEVLVENMPDSLTPASAKYLAEVLPARLAEFRQGVSKVFSDEIEQVCRDGSTVWTETTTRFVVNAATGTLDVYGVSRNIQDRKKAQDALRESEERHRLIASQMSDYVYAGWLLWDGTVRTEWIDGAFEQITGYSPERFTRAMPGGFVEVVFAEDLKRVITAQPRLFAGQAVEIEYRIRCANGETRWLCDYIKPIADERSAQGIRLMGAVQDITERKRAEDKLRASEERYRLITEYVDDIVWQLDMELKFVYLSPAVKQVLGYSEEEMRGTHVTSLLDEVGIRLMQEVIQARLKQKGTSSKPVEYRMKHKNGHWVDVEVLSAPVYGSNGDPTGFVGVTRNVSERKLVENALRASEEKFRLAFTVSPDAVNINRLEDGLYVSVNQGFTQILGYTEDEVLGKTSQELNIWDNPADRQRLVDGIKKNGVVENLEARFCAKDGSIRYGLMSASPLEIGGVPHIINITRDITERKMAEQALRQSHEMAHAILNAATESVFLIDAEGIVIAANETTAVRLGQSVADLVGARIYDFLPKGVGESRKRQVELVIREGKPVIFEDERFGVWMENSIYPIFGEDGQVQQVAVYGRDITDRKRAGEALLQSEKKYRSLHESMIDGFVRASMDGKIIEFNEIYRQMLGYSESELLGLNYPDITPEKWHAVEAQIVQDQILTRGYSDVYEKEYRRKDGSIFPVELHTVLMLDEQGQPVSMWAIARDITERKATQQKLQELNRTLEARVQQRTAEVQDLYDNAPSGYHSIDPSGRIMRMNQTELNWLGYTREEVVGRPITDFFTLESVRIFEVNFPLFKQRGWIKDLEFDFVRKNGSTFPMLVNAVAMYDEHGNLVMSRSTVFDNTERKAANEVLQRANLELERALRMKDEFLANMSHELRTPLNGILGLSEILLDGYRGTLNEHQQKFVRNIDASGKHLLSLINDLLDISKIEAGKLEIQTEQVVVAEICQASMAFVREQATKKGIALEFVPETAALTLQADLRRLKQILVNLLSNAVKFTPANGRVQLKVSTDLSSGRINFSVSDTGIGIAEADLQRLFMPFSQVDSSLTRQHDGTGLGLALVKRLTELHGGQVSVISEVGKGSCFSVSLPWAHSGQDPCALAASAQLADRRALSNDEAHLSGSLGRILLVEDNQTNIMVISDFLENIGYEVIEAGNGVDALRKADLYQPQLILMDIQIPEMDGLETTRRLRANPRFASVPIIALTALAMPNDRERSLAAGVDRYIAKPVRLKELAELIQALLQQT